jgi:hypothetical protein
MFNLKFNIMKKSMLFLSAVFALSIQILNAQTFGIKGGVNFANVNTNYLGGMSASPKPLTGIHIGAVADFKLSKRLYFNTGLLYSLKGAKVEETQLSVYRIEYLEMPLNLAYKFPLTEKSDFFIQTGPYLAYGFNGTEETRGESQIDYGLGFGAGVQFGSIVASVNYELGIADLWEYSSATMNNNNKVFQISLAYMFGKKK